MYTRTHTHTHVYTHAQAALSVDPDADAGPYISIECTNVNLLTSQPVGACMLLLKDVLHDSLTGIWGSFAEI